MLNIFYVLLDAAYFCRIKRRLHSDYLTLYILIIMRTIIASALLSLSFVVNAQTLNIVENGITYRFPASQAGYMLYADGMSLTVMGRPFALSSVDSMYIDDSVVIDNTVDVVYNGASASVFVAGNVARYVDAVTKGAHVVLLQSADLADEITYTLSGTSQLMLECSL